MGRLRGSLFLPFCAFLASCDKIDEYIYPCENTLIWSIESPDNRAKAMLVTRRCDGPALDPTPSILAIVGKDYSGSLSIESDRLVFIAGVSPDSLDIFWVDASTIKIINAGRVKNLEFLVESVNVRDLTISIEYEELSEDNSGG